MTVFTVICFTVKLKTDFEYEALRNNIRTGTIEDICTGSGLLVLVSPRKYNLYVVKERKKGACLLCKGKQLHRVSSDCTVSVGSRVIYGKGWG